MDAYQKEIMSILRLALFGEKVSLNAELDYDRIYRELVEQTLLSLTSGAIRQLPLTEKQLREWHTGVLQIVSSNVVVQKEEERLLQLLDAANIPVVVLKGSCSASFYPQNVYRTFGDIDLLVRPEDYEKTAGWMAENGYHQETQLYDDERNVTFIKNRVAIEIHRCFFTGSRKALNEIFYDALSRRVIRKAYKISVPTLPDAEVGLMQLEHMRMHLKSDELGMRQLVDWCMYANSVCSDTFWENELKPLTDRANLTQLAITATKLCKECLGILPDSSWCDHVNKRYYSSLLNVVFRSGNFGAKHGHDIVNSAVNLAANDRNVLEWLKYIQEMGVSHWPAAQNNRFLRCFAWLYQIMRYLKLSLKNKVFKKFFSKNQIQHLIEIKTINKILDE